MVNPYALSSRQPPKTQVQLGQSAALKKLEKFQAKHTAKTTGSTGKTKKNRNFSLDSSKDDGDDDDDDEDEDSFFSKAKSSNKFMKKKEPEIKFERKQSFDNERDDDNENLTESHQSDLEISVLDRSSTPLAIRKNLQQASATRSSSRLLSAASSVSSMKSMHRRSPSKVKFVKTNMNSTISDEESVIEDMLSKNLVLDIDELEAASIANASKTAKKLRKLSKSPSAMSRRSESVASIIEDDEDVFSSLTASPAPSESLIESNVILDINDLEKNLNQVADESRASSRKSHKKSHKSKDKEKSSKSQKDKKEKDKKDKKKKKDKSITSNIETFIDDSPSVATEIVDETLHSDEILSEKSQIRSAILPVTQASKSYYSDFETDQDVSRGDISTRRKQLSFAADSKRRTSALSVEIQVDPTDLLKYSNLLRSVNTYNPSSLLLASLPGFNTTSTLRDLNQITGYSLINQTFNDLIKMNLNFMKNFLDAQKTLYEQQILSIKPRD